MSTLLTAFNTRNANIQTFYKASQDDCLVGRELHELISDIFGLYVTGFSKKIVYHKPASEEVVWAVAAHFQMPVDIKSTAALLTLALRVLAAAGPDAVNGYLRIMADPINGTSAVEAATVKKIRRAKPGGDVLMQLVRKYWALKEEIPGLKKELESLSTELQQSDEEMIKIQAECVKEVVFWQWAGKWLKSTNVGGGTLNSAGNMEFPVTPASVARVDRKTLEDKMELLLTKLEGSFVVRIPGANLFSS
jgi:hypothetical protein